ncbi:MAG: EF-hand domain-containing protein [Cyclobacteriaceae bacterium]|nr:EF-hand domain-containing protein [Cyclobacteriaceae bacterium]
MLTELQVAKLTHYFNLLDFDNNGFIEKDDFIAIGENLCVIWGFKEGSDNYDKYISMFDHSWTEFRNAVDYHDPNHATIAEWLKFMDEHVVNGTDEFFKSYIRNVAEEIFDCFDVDKDGTISLDEYIDFFMAYGIPVRYSAKSYTMLDLNSDDLLSREEMLSAVEEFFRSNDKNSPGNWLYGFWEAGKSL